MKLVYKSAGGTVEMGGGNHPNINILKGMSGFGLPSKSYDEIRFAGENGVTTTGSSDLKRTITIPMNIKGDQKFKISVLEAFYHPGELYCYFGDIQRKISCKLSNSEEPEELFKSGINKFTVQFEADYPYFSDFEDTVIDLSSFENHISDEFSLPCVFTELKQSGVAYNNGNKPCYGVITLTSKYEPADSSTLITVSNTTTGKNLHINHTLRKNESVEIDLRTRRIVSSISGRITNSITDDSEMSDFYLKLGKNTISFSGSGASQPVTATLKYNNLYLMALK